MAIFGGTFDPPHKAHHSLLQEIIQTEKIDRVIVVPSHYPPGKSATAPFEKRLSWTQKVFEGGPFEVSSFEKTASHTIFAREIFYHFATFYPQARFYWVLGEDQWSQLEYWKDIDHYASLLEWIVMSREGRTTSRQGLLSRRIKKNTCSYRYAEIKRFPTVSSTTIREQIESQAISAEVEGWIPEGIKNDVLQTYQRQTTKGENH